MFISLPQWTVFLAYLLLQDYCKYLTLVLHFFYNDNGILKSIKEMHPMYKDYKLEEIKHEKPADVQKPNLLHMVEKLE